MVFINGNYSQHFIIILKMQHFKFVLEIHNSEKLNFPRLPSPNNPPYLGTL